MEVIIQGIILSNNNAMLCWSCNEHFIDDQEVIVVVTANTVVHFYHSGTECDPLIPENDDYAVSEQHPSQQLRVRHLFVVPDKEDSDEPQ